MPELPEVEAVRAGLARHLTGRRIADVEILDSRPLRRQDGGPEAFAQALRGRAITGAARRGKFLWLPLDDGRALSAHLGMSGQLLVRGTAAPAVAAASGAHLSPPGESPPDLTATRAPSLVRDLSCHPRHLRIRLLLAPLPGDAPGGVALDLVDQRMLGGMRVTELVPTADGAPGGQGSPEPLVPADAAHIARDLLDPALDRAAAVTRARSSRRAIKTVLLDQGIVSGIGNIYADEGLWHGGVHGSRQSAALSRRAVERVLKATASVMERALAVGGTSFDSLYVDVEGAPGYFARSLAVYGRAGRECRRCGATLRSEVIGGRSHTSCPRCQTRPRARGTRGQPGPRL
ncbi:bifunctional DNA-formamidopyrimidine glycosylase/DNA-(apurinic or apyrimidinic site) lyase [Actinomyces gaoshouyii]|uniref:bifunctional DNA-formamidopyrimidine glycosylase/DNA-(apurinic or apyrimidinic site) lyase n=1 Tax=Actinomyces gaoshouyii TaxID=1960083 RepID=UPI0009BD43A7|nr:bifunctional DNA-formamidopyrimidine glycosylase/DNA-(apurinic or apyrimidinic site) lyase [Actinomyces gaoshouyii]ARD41502.1 DNA-formamidopyrimidine glycosylase [Actinomyces gaoshouyii]